MMIVLTKSRRLSMQERYETYDAKDTWKKNGILYGVFDDGTIVKYNKTYDPTWYTVVDADQLTQTVKDLKNGDFEFDEFDNLSQF